ncbi:MAG: response regulator [Desulfobacterium sp.]|nr:response regulator [Desulfobacterium sp.]
MNAIQEKILFVDDEPNLLAAIKRQLRGEYTIDTALGAKEGISAVSTKGPYAVVVSDLRMPHMDGIQFLQKVKDMAPDTVRMMLSGNADMTSAIGAINRGSIFQFLLKPCDKTMLINALDQGIRQYRLLIAEKEILDKTLKGCIKVLTEVLGLVNPEAFGRSVRIKRHVFELMQYLKIKETWEIETAALLSQLGCVTIPEAVVKKIYYGETLETEERRLYSMHPLVGYEFLSHIPRMEKIAGIIHYQEKHFDGTGIPLDAVKGKELPLGARILKVILDYDTLETRGFSSPDAIEKMRNSVGRYDPDIIKILDKVFRIKEKFIARTITLKDLRNGMILREDIIAEDGVLLISRGGEISTMVLKRLFAYARNSKIKDSVSVFVPKEVFV